MSGRTANRLMAALFLVICVGFIVHELRQKPRVLILHSYHKEYSWSKEVSEGIERVFEGKHYTVHWHYMDTKRRNKYTERAVRDATQVIEQWRPNVVISIADNAQLVMKNFTDTDINIVFAGVVGDPAEYDYDGKDNVTGILERWPMDEIKSALETMPFPRRSECKRPAGEPCPLRLRHIGDDSSTGLFIATHIKDFEWGAGFEISSVSVGDFGEWQAAITTANERDTDEGADVVLFSLYHTLMPAKDDEVVPPMDEKVVPSVEVMRWTRENLKIPGVGGWGFYVEDGGMMAIAVSAYEQGEEAARLATKIIDEGKTPSMLGRLQSKQFLISLREPLLRLHGIEVPRIYEVFARTTNNYYSSRFDPDPRVEDPPDLRVEAPSAENEHETP